MRESHNMLLALSSTNKAGSAASLATVLHLSLGGALLLGTYVCFSRHFDEPGSESKFFFLFYLCDLVDLRLRKNKAICPWRLLI